MFGESLEMRAWSKLSTQVLSSHTQELDALDEKYIATLSWHTNFVYCIQSQWEPCFQILHGTRYLDLGS